MKQSVRKGMLGVVTASSVIALTTAPAHATGQSPATTHPITLTNSGNVVLRDTWTGASISCTSSTGMGTAQDPPGPLGQINSLSFSSPAIPSGWCSGPGIVVQVTASGFPWAMNTTSLPSVAWSGVRMSIVGSDNCHATISGPGGTGVTIYGTYNSSTAALTFGGVGTTSPLIVQTTDAYCDPTLFNVGDRFSLNATYKISPPLVLNMP
ncbi:hypothetical protein AB0L06_20930 [Spirillospora sp. NPDC052269]